MNKPKYEEQSLSDFSAAAERGDVEHWMGYIYGARYDRHQLHRLVVVRVLTLEEMHEHVAHPEGLFRERSLISYQLQSQLLRVPRAADLQRLLDPQVRLDSRSKAVNPLSEAALEHKLDELCRRGGVQTLVECSFDEVPLLMLTVRKCEDGYALQGDPELNVVGKVDIALLADVGMPTYLQSH